VAESKIGYGDKGMPEPIIKIGKIDKTGLFTAINPGTGLIVAYAKDSSGDSGRGTGTVSIEPIKGVDLGIFTIGFSNKMPASGETIVIYALVFNFGTEAGQGKVTFYEGNSTIGTPQYVYVIPGLNDIAFVDWTVSNGTHKLIAKITDVNPVDKNLANNEASAALVVGKSVTPPDIKIEYSVTITEKDGNYIISIRIVLVCGKDPVKNIHLVIWDSDGLSIELGISTNIDMKAGETKELYLKIIIKNTESIDRNIKVQAVGNETSSGVAMIPVLVGTTGSTVNYRSWRRSRYRTCGVLS
jgi:hypothetical protein